MWLQRKTHSSHVSEELSHQFVLVGRQTMSNSTVQHCECYERWKFSTELGRNPRGSTLAEVKSKTSQSWSQYKIREDEQISTGKYLYSSQEKKKKRLIPNVRQKETWHCLELQVFQYNWFISENSEKLGWIGSVKNLDGMLQLD